ncbi:MAG TPA: metallophosphoesterase family protein [Chryseolinea sp.]|nr:metallophosphoesterase family protein [Chryseolinea sp.]
MKIGLLSDTHDHIDPKIFAYFKDRDELWHAGDIGSLTAAKVLEDFLPLRAVHGNIDDKTVQSRFAEDLFFPCEGFNIFMTHIGGKPPTYNPRVRKILSARSPDIFICGHSHMLLVKRDATLNNMLFLNPGAAGNHGFHVMKTIVRFELNKKKIESLEVIELGKRGTIPVGDSQNL